MKDVVEKLIEIAKKDTLEQIEAVVRGYKNQIEQIAKQVKNTFESIKDLENLGNVVFIHKLDISKEKVYRLEEGSISFSIHPYSDRIEIFATKGARSDRYLLPLDDYEVFLIIKRGKSNEIRNSQ